MARGKPPACSVGDSRRQIGDIDIVASKEVNTN
jgi:hypothetical protein